MVAAADDRRAAADRRADRYDQRVCHSAFHLYIILGVAMNSPKKPIRVQELETLGVLALFFLVLNIISHRPVFVYVALALLIVALFVKPLAVQISKGWLKFAEVIGTFNSKVILSLTFYLFLTPIALLFRLCTKNPLMLKSDNASSYYTERNHTYSGADLEKMW
jgi:hypothetical protein